MQEAEPQLSDFEILEQREKDVSSPQQSCERQRFSDV